MSDLGSEPIAASDLGSEPIAASEPIAESDAGGLVIRDAAAADLAAVVALYADDILGATRESPDEPLDPGYRRGFDAVAADPRNRLLVAELDGVVVGTLQLTWIPGVSRHGAERALIEAVHVASELRGRGVGRRLATHAIGEAAARGCALVQLTSDLRRPDAHRFWQSLGFEPSHVGMKLVFEARH
ncbi:MAG TPA: GNAT family N-acetyltransferase [Acidimicrobiales bacterium]|nr:GNAT family N-acetyltransferase [Acidimicrobiales bacterium]